MTLGKYWNLDGHQVTGLYLGEFPIQGLVKESRVAAGDRIHHWIKLATPLALPWTDELRDMVILNADQIQSVDSLLQEETDGV